jgi:hypothetical protein
MYVIFCEECTVIIIVWVTRQHDAESMHQACDPLRQTTFLDGHIGAMRDNINPASDSIGRWHAIKKCEAVIVATFALRIPRIPISQAAAPATLQETIDAKVLNLRVRLGVKRGMANKRAFSLVFVVFLWLKL